MSTLLLRENPLPGLAVASFNLLVAVSLVGVSLTLTAAISLLAWIYALAHREPPPIEQLAARSALP